MLMACYVNAYVNGYEAYVNGYGYIIMFMACYVNACYVNGYEACYVNGYGYILLC